MRDGSGWRGGPVRIGGIALPLLCLGVLLGTAACAGPSSRVRSPRVDQNQLTQEELAVDPGVDLLTLIQSLRPRWLRVRERTLTGPTTVSVVIDGGRSATGLSELRRIRANEVREVRYLSPADATTQFGTDMAGGAIVVSLRR